MPIRTLAQVSALLGGAAWIACLLTETEWVWWAGAAGIGIACVLLGGGLVSGSAPALRAFTALAFPLLVGSVWWVLRDTSEGPSPQWVDAAVGVAAVVGAVASRMRHPRVRRAGIGGAHL